MPRKSLSLGSVQTALGCLGLTVKRTVDSEVRVRFRDGHAGSGHYTTDLEDALGTGIAMACERHRLPATCDGAKALRGAATMLAWARTPEECSTAGAAMDAAFEVLPAALRRRLDREAA